MTAMLDEEARATAEMAARASAAALRKVRSLAASSGPSRAFAAIATLTEIAVQVEDRLAAGRDANDLMGNLVSEAQGSEPQFDSSELRSRAG